MAAGIDVNFGNLQQALQLGMQLGQGIARYRYSRGLNDIENQQDQGQYQGADGMQTRDAAIRDLANRTNIQSIYADPTQASSGGVNALNQQYVRNAGYQAGATAAGTAANNYQDGNIPQAIRMQGAAQAQTGDLQGGISAADYAQRRQAGEDSVVGGQAATGQPAGFDPAIYSRNMAATAASQGQGQEALGWQQQALQQAQQQGQTLLGHAAMIAANPSLGTKEQAAGLMTAAATRLGFGDQHIVWDKDQNHFFAADPQTGKAVGDGFDASDLASFMSEDPATFGQRLAAVRAQQYQAQAQGAQDINKQVLDAQLERAKSYDPSKFDDKSIEQAQSALSKTTAGKAGWKLAGQIRQDPSSGAVSAWGTTPSGKPIVITQAPGSNALTITDRDGNEVDSSEFSAAGANQVQLSLKTALSKLSTDRARSAQAESLGELEAIRQQALRNNGGGALPLSAVRLTPDQIRPGGRAPTAQGAPPPGGMGPPPGLGPQGMPPAGGRGGRGGGRGALLLGNRPLANDNSGYQSPNAQLDDAQMGVESGGNTAAVSPAGARGAWQLMPATARALERQAGLPTGSTDQNPQLASTVARAYRDQLITKYTKLTGNPQTGIQIALMAYNAGEPRVDSWLQGQTSSLPRETVQYPHQILARAGETSRS